ncbi:MAG: class I SAM-dependent methyltransferase [Acidimicrobiia bacterium]
MSGANAEQRAYWNRDEARHWVEHQRRYDEMLAPFGAALLDVAAIKPSERVLDVGCGNGATTRAAARAASSGSALGVDLSEAMLERARELAKEEGVTNVSFEAGDAQTRQFDPEFDCAISRFGVMFFDDPEAAFANIRSGLVHHPWSPSQASGSPQSPSAKPPPLRADERVAFVVWQELLANEWMAVPGAAILEFVELPSAEPGAPGPYALADTDRVRAIFGAAGYRDLAIGPFSAPMLVGGRGTLDEAVAFMRNTGMAHALLDDKPADVQEKALAAVRDALEPRTTDEGVLLSGAAWLITARA